MLSEKDMLKLKEHSKLHKGGMRGKHMKNMKKFMLEGMSFAKAHNKAKKMDLVKPKVSVKPKVINKSIIKSTY